jgi:hypothetical protein
MTILAIEMKRLIFVLFHVVVWMQHSDGQPSVAPPDSTTSRRNFKRAAATFILAETVPFLFDRYVAEKDYARISFQTVGYNLHLSSWSWDNDGFQTNQIGHPYHGSLFFNAFRSNGYSFWESVPATFVGSYLWETFAENQPPAPNDFINTGFGGIVLGEMTHRLTSRLLAAPSRGIKRQMTEVLAFLINPSNGFTRIVSGQWGRPTQLSGTEDSINIAIELQAGLRKYGVNNANPFRDGKFGPYGRIRLVYGDPYRYPKIPFSYLHITTEFGQDDSSKLNIVSVYGSLTGWLLPGTKFRHALALSANYEYINNEAFFYSAQSIRMNLYSDFTLLHGVDLRTVVAGGPIILAAIPNAYLYHARDYDYGPGLAFSLSGHLTFAGRLSYDILYRGGWMRPTDGNATQYFLQALTNEISVRVFKNAFIVMQSGYFTLHGSYLHYQTVDRSYPYLHLSIRFRAG